MSAPAALPPEKPVTYGQALRKRNPPGSLTRKLLAWHSALVYVFLYAPILILIIYSFNASKQNAVWTGFTLDWYRKLFENEQIIKATRNSLIIAGWTTLFCTVAGTLVALALSRHQYRGKGLTQSMLYLPMIIPEIVVGAAMLSFFSVMKYRLGLGTVVIAHVVFCLSYVTIVVKARLAGFDRSLEEAAMDLGANGVQTFWRVTLPLIMPAVVSGALLVFTISLDDFVITMFVSGPGSNTLPLYIYSSVKVGVTPEMNAVSAVLLTFTIVIIAISQRLQQDPPNKEKP